MELKDIYLDKDIHGYIVYQSFIMKTNVRSTRLVIDIYFKNGKAYSYYNELVEVDDSNKYQKYIRKYKLEDIVYE